MKIAALAGGVGGAKLAHGLAQILPPEDLAVIVNTGDDFVHYGLNVSPDLDTVCYTLAGLANLQTGWGRAGETWQVLEGLVELGGEAWFRLGDKDLATHLERTRRLQAGEKLSQITASFCERWGIGAKVLPMTDDQASTWVRTVEMGDLPFQEYFVKYGCQPKVAGFIFKGIESAVPAPEVMSAIEEADAVVICPSNPWVSIGPILALPGIKKAIEEKPVSVAVSPIIGGKALKGPAAKMFAELGIEPSSLAVAAQYRSWLKGIILDRQDESEARTIQWMGVQPYVADTIMVTPSDRILLAEKVLGFCQKMIENKELE